MSKKIILVESNEIPLRVFDMYASKRPNSALAKLRAASIEFETYTEDSLALDPWISWPTFHRGVTDEKHQILHLGQPVLEIDKKYPPIWKILKQNRRSVGVFGSLYSSNVPADVAEYAFYLPDYFDDKVFAHPRELLPFQELNVSMTRASARNVTRKVPKQLLWNFAKSARRSGLRMNTVGSSIAHMASEVINPARRIRRRNYQPMIMADLFVSQLKKTEPDFATFYTNHVAAAMHRYWAAAFPGDYETPMDSAWIKKYSDEILSAMGKLDVIIEQIVKFVDKNPEYVLMLGGSMGQAAVPAQETHEFLTIVDPRKFMSWTGIPDDKWSVQPAMVPCVCIAVDAAYRDVMARRIAAMSIDGHPIVDNKRPTTPISFNEQQKGFFQVFIQFDNYAGEQHLVVEGKKYDFAEAGIGMMAHEDGVNCTAQHIPDGVLYVYSPKTPAAVAKPANRLRVSTVDIVPSIMDHFGIQPAEYMTGRPSLSRYLS